ncbi:terminal uridylyltransferase 7 [Pelodytes ibericus]
MGDSTRKTKQGGLMDDEEFKRDPIMQYPISEGHGNTYPKKHERATHKKKAIPLTQGSSPRNGPNQNTLQNFSSSPSGLTVTIQKDGKRCFGDEQRSNSGNWRDRGSNAHRRTRKDSNRETEDDGPWQQAGDRDFLMHGKPKSDWRHRQSEPDEDDYQESPDVEMSTLSKTELLGLQQAEERLKKDFIYRLKRRPRRCTSAVYTCKLCDFLIESVKLAHKHIKDRRHRRNIKEKKEEQHLTTLPPPTLPQIQAVGIAIDTIVKEHGLYAEEVAKRLTILKAMENLIQHTLPECSLRLYGSSFTRFGFKTSDLNVDVKFPPSMNQPDVLLLVQERLKESDLFTDFDVDFHARVPVVVFREKQSGFLCKVSAGNENTCQTTLLLATLSRLEPRLVSLVIAFRYWAKLCCLDRPEEGGLPPYVFALMVVFFLQQRKEPVLPVYFGSWVDGCSISKLGQLSLGAIEEEMVMWEYAASPERQTASHEENLTTGKASLVFDTDQQCPVSTGQLWVEMLRFYALEFNMADLVISIRVKENVSRELKDWPKKRIAVEDPYSVKRNVARSLNSQLVYDYMIHCLKSTYKYFAMPQRMVVKSNLKKTTVSNKTATQDLHSDSLHADANYMAAITEQLEHVVLGFGHPSNGSAEKIPQSQDNESDSVCNLSMTKLVCDVTNPDSTLDDLDCMTEEFILCDPDEALQSCEELESGHEESEEEDNMLEESQEHYLTAGQGLDEDSEGDEVPVAGNEETDSLSDCEAFANTERNVYGLENCRRFKDTVDLDEDSTDELEETCLEHVTHDFDHIAVKSSENEEEVGLMLQRPHLDSLTAEGDFEHACTGSADDLLSEDDQVTQEPSTCLKDHSVNHGVDVPVTEAIKTVDSVKETLPVNSMILDDDQLFYEFNKPTFTRGKLPTVVCNLCKREGHLKKDCPEDFKKIELDPLPPLTSKFRNVLDQVCIQCYKDFSPTSLEDIAREHIRLDLEDFIRRDFKGARLRLFGSSKNGFGFKQSDLDICMTIDGIETDEDLDCIRTIEELARLLRKHQGLRNILSITSAKVPIVKFYHLRSGLEGDISLYNTLALHNTQLLASYAAIDPRVKYLCYTMKVFTKMCDIGDASRGSLSSYAYTLMVLFFLQQRNPPVIPVLQEIYRDQKKLEILVDGWNAYFFSRLDELEKYWPYYGKNKESVGELWLGLLRYYTEDFDFKEHVICIRRKSLLTTFKKQWTSKYIVIEDPFDLNHNLGAGLSRKMTNFIMKAFINGRHVFGTPVKEFPKEYPTKMEYFFDPEVLTEGELAPNDRCCRICGKIGHFMKECPKRRNRVRRQFNEGAANQRYPEKRVQRRMDEGINKNMESDSLGKDGKLLNNSNKSPRQGVGSTPEKCRDRTPRPTNEKWRRQEDRDLREKRCFICGREGHIKKECPQFKGSAGSPKSDMSASPSGMYSQKHQAKSIQVMQSQDGKKKLSFSPHSGSLSSKYMSQGKASQKKAQQDS